MGLARRILRAGRVSDHLASVLHPESLRLVQASARTPTTFDLRSVHSQSTLVLDAAWHWRESMVWLRLSTSIHPPAVACGVKRRKGQRKEKL
jgi:hypothetical protein